MDMPSLYTEIAEEHLFCLRVSRIDDKKPTMLELKKIQLSCCTIKGQTNCVSAAFSIVSTAWPTVHLHAIQYYCTDWNSSALKTLCYPNCFYECLLS